MATPSPDASGVIDRRRLLQLGTAGAVVGATWVTPSLLSIDKAFAAASACTVASGVNWAGITSHAPGKTVLTAGWLVGTFGATTVTFQVTDTNNRLVYPPDTNFPQYNTGAQPTTHDDGFTGFFSMLMDHAAHNDLVTLKIMFGKKIKGLKFSVTDLSTGTGPPSYIDQVMLTALNGSTPVPIGATSGGNPTVTGSGTTSVTALATAVPTGNANSTVNNANITIAGPFDSLTVVYSQQANVTSANGAFQYVGLSNFTWSC